MSVCAVNPTRALHWRANCVHYSTPVCSLVRRTDVSPRCAASFWDILPDELQELCYQLNHKKAMNEVLEELHEKCEGLGDWGYYLNFNGIRPIDPKQSGSRNIAIDFEDYYKHYKHDTNIKLWLSRWNPYTDDDTDDDYD
tara:strand:+ start:217 stop:636 length:420 start_codon:yes stop_codon:yes gene_type:complete